MAAPGPHGFVPGAPLFLGTASFLFSSAAAEAERGCYSSEPRAGWAPPGWEIAAPGGGRAPPPSPRTPFPTPEALLGPLPAQAQSAWRR